MIFNLINNKTNKKLSVLPDKIVVLSPRRYTYLLFTKWQRKHSTQSITNGDVGGRYTQWFINVIISFKVHFQPLTQKDASIKYSQKQKYLHLHFFVSIERNNYISEFTIGNMPRMPNGTMCLGRDSTVIYFVALSISLAVPICIQCTSFTKHHFYWILVLRKACKARPLKTFSINISSKVWRLK